MKKASHCAGPFVIFEAGNRTGSLITELSKLFPDREACVCREMTKLHEETIRAKLSDLDTSPRRGEVVIVVGPGEPIQDEGKDLRTLKDISEAIANLWGIRKRDAYNILVGQKPE